MSRRDVELRLLRYFVVTAEERHVGRAASRLFISQPALSKQIRLLEREWRVELFHRGPRGVTLTADGATLLSAARETLEANARLVDLVDHVSGDLTGRLAVGFVGQAANELTPLLLRRFGEEHPGVAVELTQYNLRDVSAGLRDRRVDVAIIRLPVDLDGLITAPLFSEPRMAVLPDDHPLAARPQLSVRDLFAEPWLQPDSTDPRYRAFALAGAQREAPAVLGPVVRTIDELLEAVLAHRGVCLAPASAQRYYSRPGISYRAVDDAEPSVVALAWPGRPHTPSAAAAAFVDLGRRLALAAR